VLRHDAHVRIALEGHRAAQRLVHDDPERILIRLAVDGLTGRLLGAM
jgi:hypothetical protein